MRKALPFLLIAGQLWAATYYVRKSGSDSNNGTSPATAWLTIGKALGASGISSGDTVYIGAGTYRETVTVNMTSATAETRVIGDVTGQYTGDQGGVTLTAHTTNDKTISASASALNLNGRDYLTFQDIVLVAGRPSSGGSGGAVDAPGTSQQIKFSRCTFIGSDTGSALNLFRVQVGYGLTAGWLFDSCLFMDARGVSSYNGRVIVVSGALGDGADYDVDVKLANCLFLGAAASFVELQTSGSGANGPGGVRVYNSSFFGAGSALRVNSSAGSTTIPCAIYNSYLYLGGSTALQASVTGQLLENRNLIWAVTPRTNVSAGADSIANTYANLVEIGQSNLRDAAVRPFGMPSAGSPLLGFGAEAGGPTADILGVLRPAGGESTLHAVGAFERSDTGAKEAAVVRSGATALKVVGPGYHDFYVPVAARQTTISVWGRYDSSHGTLNKPQMKVLAASACGVSEATDTMTAAVDTWQRMSLTFTPIADCILTVRLISRAAAGSGIAYFDDFSFPMVPGMGFSHYRQGEPLRTPQKPCAGVPVVVY